MQITMRQLQATLRDLGLFNMALSEAERDADLMAKWRKPATVIDRSDPEVERLRRHFGASSGNIDLLFKKAAQKPGGPPSGALSVVRETEPPWLTLARSYLGTKEVPGRGSNGTIDGFFRDAGYPGYRDETSWCAAFVGAVLARSGYPRLADLTARSGRYYGQKLDGPKIGCVVVFWRESPTSWKGHIGFVTGIDWDKKTLRVLGGNQNDAVTEATFAMSRVLAYRWPVAATVKALKSAGSTEARLLDAAKNDRARHRRYRGWRRDECATPVCCAFDLHTVRDAVGRSHADHHHHGAHRRQQVAHSDGCGGPSLPSRPHVAGEPS